MPVESAKFVTASRALEELAKESEAAGEHRLAEKFFRAAAEVELSSDELQACWGGAFNGQEGRRAMFEDLLERFDFAALIETGTYRGSTTAWMAERFKGPILTCEHAPLYFFQAQRRLALFENVKVHLRDSREFLSNVLQESQFDGPVLFYLDAHWGKDLPLSEEMRIILANCTDPVIMIDDFKVPFDRGYEWDDYGPGSRIDLDQLKWLQSSDCRFFFPSLPSSRETGAARGVCIIATKRAEELVNSPLFRSADWRDWKLTEVQRETEMASIDRATQGVEENAPTEPLVSHSEIRNSVLQQLRVDIADSEQRTADRLFRLATLIQQGLESEKSAIFRDQLEQFRQNAVELLEERIELLSRSVAHYFDQDQERKDLGRSLVEERAHNLEAVRRFDALRSQLEDREARLSVAEQEIKSLEEKEARLSVAEQEIKTLTATLATLKGTLETATAMVKGLCASRALKAIRFLSSAPISTAQIARSALESAEKLLAEVEPSSGTVLGPAYQHDNLVQEPGAAVAQRSPEWSTRVRSLERD